MRTFLSIRLSVVLFILASSIVDLAGSPAQKSNAEDRDKVVKIARMMEADPLNKDVRKMREWALYWVIQSPDVHIQLCTDYLGEMLHSKSDYKSELTNQEVISMAAFIIEHPDMEKDNVAVHQAGIESVLKAYESILKTKPKGKIDFLDGLIAKRDKGELKGYVEEISKTKCKQK